MSIETTVLDFKLSNTFEEYEAHMNAPEQQAMFKEMGVKTFYIGKSCNEICKLLLSELSKHEIGYQNLFNIILYYARNADFNNDLYDFEN